LINRYKLLFQVGMLLKMRDLGLSSSQGEY
jgi:hypothetical protein